MLHTQIGATTIEGERLIRGIADNVARMEAELQAAVPLKLELQKAQGEAQNLVVSREEIVSKAQQLMQELQRTHADVQQIPALISELEGLRQQYQQCRAAFEYEKKVYNDHLESLKEMEKNYAFISREMEKLQAELTNTANVDQRSSMCLLLLLFSLLGPFKFFMLCGWIMVCNKMQVVLLASHLELLTMRLLVFLWDKMHTKMVMLLQRDVVSSPQPVLLMLVLRPLLELILFQLLQALVIMLQDGLIMLHLQVLLMIHRGPLLNDPQRLAGYDAVRRYVMIHREEQISMLKQLIMMHREVQVTACREVKVMICREDLLMMHQEELTLKHSQEVLLVLMDMLRQQTISLMNQ